jgi:hypothetical protein
VARLYTRSARGSIGAERAESDLGRADATRSSTTACGPQVQLAGATARHSKEPSRWLHMNTDDNEYEIPGMGPHNGPSAEAGTLSTTCPGGRVRPAQEGHDDAG